MKSYFAILLASLAVAGVGVALAMHGEADDAPGLALIGIVLIVGAFALGVRTAYARGQASGNAPRAD
jgi:multisubunit Na+/H+ antiporter MnhB subunit